MNSRELVLAHLAGRPVDRLPLMPITMQFACGLIGAKYRDYGTDHRVLVEGQLRVAEQFGFDYVNTMSDPAREAADCGAVVEYFEDSPAAMVEEQALLADKTRLATLQIPDPLGGGRMHNSLKAIALFKEKMRGEKLIEGWIEGPMAKAADLRGINTLMLDFYESAVHGHLRGRDALSGIGEACPAVKNVSHRPMIPSSVWRRTNTRFGNSSIKTVSTPAIFIAISVEVVIRRSNKS